MMSLVFAMLGQLYQAPLPQYDPAGYHRAYPEWIGPAVHGVGPTRTIRIPTPMDSGTIKAWNPQKQLFSVQLTSGETVLVHYGQHTPFWGTGPVKVGRQIFIDKMNRSIILQ